MSHRGQGKAMQIRDRVKEFRRVQASELVPNPKNWRRHPQSQLDAIRGVFDEVGFAGAELARELPDGTLMLIDGHARAGIAGDAIVPVLVLDVDEAEADKLLATFDPIGAMATAGAVALNDLLKSVETRDDAICKMLGSLAVKSGLYDLSKAAKDAEADIEKLSDNSSFGLKDVAVFKSASDLGIPDLLPDMIPSIPDNLQTYVGDHLMENTQNSLCVFKWRAIKNVNTEDSVLCFYTADNVFESMWYESAKETEKLLKDKWFAVVSPNFSLIIGDPKVVHLWNVYRSRWLARYWQGAGIKVIPDIEWTDAKSFDYCLLGIPIRPASVAIQIQTTIKTKEEDSQREYGINKIVEELKPESMLVYYAKESQLEITRSIVKNRCRTVFCLCANNASRQLRKLKESR